MIVGTGLLRFNGVDCDRHEDPAYFISEVFKRDFSAKNHIRHPLIQLSPTLLEKTNKAISAMRVGFALAVLMREDRRLPMSEILVCADIGSSY